MFKQISPKEIETNVFSLIGEQWMLVTAGTAERCNTMTASWGGLGVLWGAPMATIYIRPQRYTFEFLEKSDTFSLCFFPPQYREALALCGSKSGRDVDKIKQCGLTVLTSEEGTPYFEQAQLALICKKTYWQDLDHTHFLDEAIEQKWYNKDYHRMYFGEILRAYRRKD